MSAIHCSTSSGCFGMPAEIHSGPFSVISTSSSMRMPIPRYSGGISRSSSRKYRPGSMVKIMPGSIFAPWYDS